jgi:hypothetical protein
MFCFQKGPKAHLDSSHFFYLLQIALKIVKFNICSVYQEVGSTDD